MTIKFNENGEIIHIECSICGKNPNVGKYFFEKIVFFWISKKRYELVQKGAVIMMGKIRWNPKWKVYQDWKITNFAKVKDPEVDYKNDYFAIFCPNCACDSCQRLTIFAEIYDKSRQNRYCDNDCKPFWEFWPEKDKNEFENAIKDSKIKITKEK